MFYSSPESNWICLFNLFFRTPIKFITVQGIQFINTFTTNTTVEPFQGTTTRGSGLMKELKSNARNFPLETVPFGSQNLGDRNYQIP